MMHGIVHASPSDASPSSYSSSYARNRAYGTTRMHVIVHRIELNEESNHRRIEEESNRSESNQIESRQPSSQCDLGLAAPTLNNPQTSARE